MALEASSAKAKVCANSQVKQRILHTSTCCNDDTRMKRLQSRHALAAHTKLTVSIVLLVWKVSVPDS